MCVRSQHVFLSGSPVCPANSLSLSLSLSGEGGEGGGGARRVFVHAEVDYLCYTTCQTDLVTIKRKYGLAGCTNLTQQMSGYNIQDLFE